MLLYVLAALLIPIFGLVGFLLLGVGLILRLSFYPVRRRNDMLPTDFGASYENVRFPSADGVSLAGWFIPSQEETPKGAIILCHGMNSARGEMLPWAETLWRDGFSLLLYDFRACGESGGERCTAGYEEPRDLQGALDYLANRPETHGLPIGVFGFSMGGATAILTAAEDPRIRGVATHGAYADMERAIQQRCRRHFGFMAPIAAWMIKRIAYRLDWLTISPAHVAPVQAVSALAPRPLLIMHGMRDRIILPEDAHDLHRAAGSNSALAMLPNSGHRHIDPDRIEEARSHVSRFFQECLIATDTEENAEPSSPKKSLSAREFSLQNLPR